MADDRKCYAGDLTSDVLGKVVRVKVDERTVIEDVVLLVEHRLGIADAPVTRIMFENVVGRNGIRLPDSAAPAFVVDHDELVTVLS